MVREVRKVEPVIVMVLVVESSVDLLMRAVKEEQVWWDILV